MLKKGGGVHFVAHGNREVSATTAGKSSKGTKHHRDPKTPRSLASQGPLDWYTCYQYLDYMQKTYHCPGANSNGIGVEFCNPFFQNHPLMPNGEPVEAKPPPHNPPVEGVPDTFVGPGAGIQKNNLKFAQTAWHGAGGISFKAYNNRYVIGPLDMYEAGYALSLKVVQDLPHIPLTTTSYFPPGHPKNSKGKHIFVWEMGRLSYERDYINREGKEVKSRAHSESKGKSVQTARYVKPAGIASHYAFGGHSDGKPNELYVQLRLWGNSAEKSYACIKGIIQANQPGGLDKYYKQGWKVHSEQVRNSVAGRTGIGRSVGTILELDGKHKKYFKGIRIGPEVGNSGTPKQQVKIVKRNASGFIQDCTPQRTSRIIERATRKMYAHAKRLASSGGTITVKKPGSLKTEKKTVPKMKLKDAVRAAFYSYRRNTAFLAQKEAELKAELEAAGVEVLE